MELIDRNKLIMHVADCKLSESITWEQAELVTDFLLNAPTVGLIYCKDCKWIDKALEAEPISLTNAIEKHGLIGYCKILKFYVRAEDYCSIGEVE